MGLRIDSFDDSFVSSWLLVRRALRFGSGAVPGDTRRISHVATETGDAAHEVVLSLYFGHLLKPLARVGCCRMRRQPTA